MIFEEAGEMTALIELKDLEKKPDIILEHFMKYGDEVFYVLDDDEIYGIITLGDLYRAYASGSTIPKVNRNFSYIETENDYESAQKIFEQYTNIHEVAVVKKKKLIGVLKSGHRKSWDDWRNTRDCLQNTLFELQLEKDRKEWIQRDIQSLSKLKAKLFVYRYLCVEDMDLTDDERTIFEEKSQLPTEAMSALTQKEQKIFFGENNDPQYIEQLINYIVNDRKIIYRNGIPVNEDISNRIVNIKNGYRIVPNVWGGADRKIFMVGPCTMFGGLVNDAQTIEAYLQEILIGKQFQNYEVVNCSVTGVLSFPRLFHEKISEDDIVIIMSPYFDTWKVFEKIYPEKIRCLESMSEVWSDIHLPIYQIYNMAEHCNHVVNRKIAEKIFKDIEGYLSIEMGKGCRESLQNYYISWEIAAYYKRHFRNLPNRKQKGKIGSVVMNCNPFTKGHRYLIEQACAKLDYLYVLVVEEDKSDFAFSDRIEMVKRGVEDIENVCVIPSGEYVISAKTFAQYFKKEQIENVEDMDYDIHIFGEIVAKELGIQYRFVGEEPYDMVTAKYNRTMMNILPQHGVKVIEITRLKDDDGEIISASKVRKCISEGSTQELLKMLPASTIEYLNER